MKVLVVGPSKSHKTALVSFLAGLRDVLDGWSPGPTLGCRILETERQGGGGVEVWDVGGNVADESLWPAMRSPAPDGVMVVYDPDVPGNTKEAELWYSWFVTQQGIERERVAVVALSQSGTGPGSPPPAIDGIVIECVPLSTEEGGPTSRKVWDRLLSRLAKRGGAR